MLVEPSSGEQMIYDSVQDVWQSIEKASIQSYVKFIRFFGFRTVCKNKNALFKLW